MEIIITLFLAAGLTAAIAAYLKLFFCFKPQPVEPCWFSPLVCALMGIILAFGAHVEIVSYGNASFAPVISALIIAWAGWTLLGLKRG